MLRRNPLSRLSWTTTKIRGRQRVFRIRILCGETCCQKSSSHPSHFSHNLSRTEHSTVYYSEIDQNSKSQLLYKNMFGVSNLTPWLQFFSRRTTGPIFTQRIEADVFTFNWKPCRPIALPNILFGCFYENSLTFPPKMDREKFVALHIEKNSATEEQNSLNGGNII